MLHHWGQALINRSSTTQGANPEAALGMPTLFDHAWPAYLAARRDRLGIERCRLQALFTAIAVLPDTNLVRRGGIDGLRFAQAHARAFLDRGGAGHPDAIDHARRIGAAFAARRLSPGGSADVLAGVCFLARIDGG